MAADLLERWLEELLATRGLTAIRDPAEARRMLVDDATRAAPLLVDAPDGAVVDVGSGGGSPGVPLALELPGRDFVLLDAQRRRCDFLRRVTGSLPNVEVVWGRAESQPVDTFAASLAKALAKPPVAAELCLPLVRLHGIAILWTSDSADLATTASVAEQLGGVLESSADGLVTLRKVAPTPPGFPRRAGMAQKRPLS